MKLNELALKVDTNLAYSAEDLSKVKDFFIESGKLLQLIEGNKFKLLKYENNIGLFTSDDTFVGFLTFKNVDESIISLEKIFILPDFRNQKIAKIFVYWFKMSMKKAVFIGGAIFNDGQNFIKSIINDPRFEDDITGYNVRSKEKFKFDLSKFFDEKQFTGILIEQFDDFYGMYDNSLPGQPVGSDLICLEMFTSET